MGRMKDLNQKADEICALCDYGFNCDQCVMVVFQDNKEIKLSGKTREIKEVKDA